MHFRISNVSNLFIQFVIVFCTFALLLSCSKTDPESGLSDEGAKRKLAGEVVILPQEDGTGATELISKVDCDPHERRRTQVHLSWQPATSLGEGQYVQVSIFKHGFENGRYILSKELSADTNTYLFDEVAGQALHRWRVLTKQGNQYIASDTKRFEGALCLQDIIGREPPVIIE